MLAVVKAEAAPGAEVREVKIPAFGPNDVLVRGRKVAGILTELSAERERIQFAILGIGLNVNLQKGDLPPEIAELATSLRIERGEPVPRAFLLAALLAALESWIATIQEEGFAAVRTRWLELSATLGKRVRVETGKKPLEGQAYDLDADGALLVRDDAGKTHRIVAGDVEIEE